MGSGFFLITGAIISDLFIGNAGKVISDRQTEKLLSLTNNRIMAYHVDFKNVSEIGFETSPVAKALAGLRANEARYFKNKFNQEFIVHPVSQSKETLNWVSKILKEERNISISSKPLETAALLVDGIKWIYVFYENGLSVNVLYTINNPKKRAVGFKLSDGMEIPEELGKFKFARQKSKLAGTIRGSFFVIKKEY